MNRIPLLVFIFMILYAQMVWGAGKTQKGQYEISVFYSLWSIDLLRSRIESEINNAGNDLIQDEILKAINDDYPDLTIVDSTLDSTFDSGGGSIGVEFRWYPKGKAGSFSLGLGLVKSKMRLSLPDVAVNMALKSEIAQQQGEFNGNVTAANVVLKPLSLIFSMRWDIMPSSQVRPYFTFGLGLFPVSVIQNTTAEFIYSGILQVNGQTGQIISDRYENTVEGAIEDGGEDDPLKNFPFIPVLQMNFGIKGEVAHNIFLFLDLGVFNGFSISGGIAYRL